MYQMLEEEHYQVFQHYGLDDIYFNTYIIFFLIIIKKNIYKEIINKRNN